MHTDPNAAPINPLPAVVWLLALPIIAMEVVMNLASAGVVGGAQGVGWRQDAVQRFAFSPDFMRDMIANNYYPLEHLMRLVTYPIVHVSFTHAIFVVVFLLALGKMVGEVFRPWAVLVVFFGATLAGAGMMTALPFIHSSLIGGYPAVYGLIGAFTFLLWTNLAGSGASQYRAFSLIGMLMGIQLVFGLIFGGGWDWVAELSGFFAGFLLSFVVSPGGWERVREKIRERG
ncbi:rhomboid family intramembrane serine protease [Pseudorhodobacter turbinis]|uniref:Rhomboid family intramembrane serine protease n=1 Tax=Pseudorhodobacter turbinis TaxID=2500533 RepID=A0A4P8EFG6_9RHOB|nr:rhomboid family intramembrane serine protease [Pseudorhodobacter turbinis]QCO55606.1 rhomboid family intramembrane serine protease [Pseudorhodobacter turbinis]